MVSCKPLDEDEVKQDTDGALSRERSLVSTRGVIQDAKERWLTGFAMKIGNCSVINAELWAILKGLMLC